MGALPPSEAVDKGGEVRDPPMSGSEAEPVSEPESDCEPDVASPELLDRGSGGAVGVGRTDASVGVAMSLAAGAFVLRYHI